MRCRKEDRQGYRRPHRGSRPESTELSFVLSKGRSADQSATRATIRACDADGRAVAVTVTVSPLSGPARAPTVRVSTAEPTRTAPVGALHLPGQKLPLRRCRII